MNDWIVDAVVLLGFAAWTVGLVLSTRSLQRIAKHGRLDIRADRLAAIDQIYRRPWAFIPIVVSLWLRTTRMMNSRVDDPRLESQRVYARRWLGSGLALILLGFGLFLAPVAVLLTR